ncbi:MAG: DVU0524 family FlgM-associated protein [Pseudomonadota bacterium]
MSITTYQVQNVLRTYGRQLNRRDTLSRVAEDLRGEGREEYGTVSAEAKRQEVISRITRELVSRIAQQQSGAGRGRGGEDEEALQKLSSEYGSSLRFSIEDGVERFYTVDEQAGRLVALPKAESEALRRKLYELTRNLVEQNMARPQEKV